MSSEQLIKIIDFWQKVATKKDLFPRSITNKINIKGKEIIDLIGPRRSGKSSVLKLIIQKIKNKGNWLYVNFEDPFFAENNSPAVIEEIIEVYKEYFNKSLKYLFFDEIQNISKWETAVRKLRDSEKYKIFITGSSSKLLSRELSTLISGRHLSYELLPLSFGEYLIFKNVKITNKKDIILNKTNLLKHFDRYLKTGGFPEIVLTDNKELVKQYYDDIVQKDIVNRYDIREKDILRKMGIFLIGNSSKIVSIASLKNLYGISYELASNYIEYFKESFLIFDLPQFDYSIKSQQKALKKTYAIDTGLVNAVSFQFSENRGRMLENVVFLELKRMNMEIFYYKSSKNEVDFIVNKSNREKEFIQVCWEVNEDNITRELSGLEDAMSKFGVKKGKILTYDQKGSIKIKNIGEVEQKPVYEWILGEMS